MPYTWAERRDNVAYSNLGYKIEEGPSIEEFLPGEAIIVITKKGEPVMSGRIEQILSTPETESSVLVNGKWFSSADYYFRTA